MKHEPRSTSPVAPADDEFEQDERPTRPAPPPPEHLRLLRSGAPRRARVAARRRPALTAATQSWLATKPQGAPRTATSRWRAIAATVLGGGTGRQSFVDSAERAPAASPSVVGAPEPEPQPEPALEPVAEGSGGDELPIAGTATTQRALLRRGIAAACVAVFLVAAVSLARRGGGAAPGEPVAVASTLVAPPLAPVVLDPPATAASPTPSTESPSLSATTSTPPAPSPRHVWRPHPQKRPGSNSSSIL